MRHITSKVTYNILSLATGMISAAATGVIAKAAWKAFRNDPPPANPENPDTAWKDALMWTLATAITAGITRVIVMRGAAQGWRNVTGELPPNVQHA